MALRTPLTVSPHMYIGDSTGRPLDYGMVYFGEPDKDPEFYPIDIFSDDELKTPVTQPVRTKGGYLNDNKGDMAEIHAKELIYSVKVLDQYGRKIFYKGQSMRSTWNDDVIIRIDEAIIDSSKKAESIARKVSEDALEGVAIDANLVTDAVIKTVPKNGGIARNQAAVNQRVISIKDYPVASDATTDDAATFKTAIDANHDLILEGASVVNQVIIDNSVALVGKNSSELSCTATNKHIMYVGHPTYAPEYGKNTVSDFSISTVKFKNMPVGTSDDFIALKFAHTVNANSRFNSFRNVESALGTAGALSHDNLSIGDYLENINRMSFQNFASYSRIIGLATHNNGDNRGALDYGGVNNNGLNVGIRLAGLSEGSVVLGCNIRDKQTAFTHQKGSNYHVLTGNYISNVAGTAVEIASGATGRSRGIVHSGFVINNAARNALNLRKGAFYRVDGLVANGIADSEFTAIDARNMDATGGARKYRVEYKNGSGVMPPVGTKITVGGITGDLESIDGDNLQDLNVGGALPTNGEILLKNVTGTTPAAGAIVGISADAVNTYSPDGRHRIDVTLEGTTSSGLLLGSDCNVVTLLASMLPKGALTLDGNYNLVDIVVDDNKSAIHVTVNGNKNNVRIIDNSRDKTNSMVRVYGSNNVLNVVGDGNVLVYGASNTLTVDCNNLALVAGSIKNKVYGRCTVLSDVGTNNDVKSMYGASYVDSVTVTTNVAGEAIITHNMIAAAKTVFVNADDSRIVKILNKKQTSSSIKLLVTDNIGAPVSLRAVVLDVQAFI